MQSKHTQLALTHSLLRGRVASQVNVQELPVSSRDDSPITLERNYYLLVYKPGMRYFQTLNSASSLLCRLILSYHIPRNQFTKLPYPSLGTKK